MQVDRKGVAAILLVLALALLILGAGPVPEPGHVDRVMSFNTAMWEYRGFDLLGQVMLLIAGSIGIVLLLREESRRA